MGMIENITTEEPEKVETGEKESTYDRLMKQRYYESADYEKKQEEAEAKSPFRRFLQINKQNAHYLTQLAIEQPKAMAILLFIFENMDSYNALICSYAVFQERFDMSRDRVRLAIKYLKEHGYIAVYKSGTSNVYVANDTLVWQSAGKNLKYSKFPSNVILTSSEQERALKKPIYESTKTITQKKKEAFEPLRKKSPEIEEIINE